MRPLFIFAAFALLAPTFACSAGVDPEPTSSTDEALINRGGFGVDGDNCSINLPSGLKEPGTMKDGKCCSVFDATKCVDMPKSLKLRSVGTSPGGPVP